MSSSTLNVFVYGTLQPGGRFHDEFCSAYQYRASRAWTRGRLYNFPERGFPAAVEDPAQQVYGHLLSFKTTSPELLDSLDALEGYYPDRRKADNFYYRLEVDVYIEDATTPIIAWCYFMPAANIHLYRGEEVPSGRWSLPAVT